MSLKGKEVESQPKDYTGDYQCNFAGISSFLSKVGKCDSIVDSGATHHITPFRRVLADIKAIDRQHGV